MNSSRLLIKVLVKPGCPPCNMSSYVVKKLQEKYDFDMTMINVRERKYKNYAEYANRLPLIFIGDYIMEGKINEFEIANKLEELNVKKLK